MSARCICVAEHGQSFLLTDCLKFSLLRERYTAYGTFWAQFLSPEPVPAPIMVQFALDGRLLHYGMVLHSECRREAGQYRVTITARSYTAALTRNQPVPGMHYNVTLGSLLEEIPLPHVTSQTGVPEINYVFVKDGCVLWDMLLAYNYKLNRGFPMIRVPNLVCVEPPADRRGFLLGRDRLLAEGSGQRSGEMLSRADMADAVGEYGSFTASNPAAADRDIVRVRQLALDRQFLYAPEDALRFRLALSNRRRSYRTLRYRGYLGEDIGDTVQLSGGDPAEVGRILIKGDKNGVVTEDTFYYDDFCN